MNRTLTLDGGLQIDIPKEWPNECMFDVSVAKFDGTYFIVHPNHEPRYLRDGEWHEMKAWHKLEYRFAGNLPRRINL